MKIDKAPNDQMYFMIACRSSGYGFIETNFKFPFYFEVLKRKVNIKIYLKRS